MILNLNYEVLKTIMLLVVASAGGVTDLAKAMAVCKMFSMFGDDKDLLKMTNFKDFDSSNAVENCEHVRSLLIRCAEAGNADAEFILAKVILLRFSQLENLDMLPPLLSYFMPEQPMNSDSDKGKLTHLELVGLFLSRCSILDHVSMLPHVQNYVDHFRSGIKGFTKFFYYYNYMTSILLTIVDVGRYRIRFYSPNMLNYCPVEPEMRSAKYVLDYLARHSKYYFINFTDLSQWKWEELMRECSFMVEELFCFDYHVEPLEESEKVLDMGKRIFYYLAFNGPITREMDLALDRDGDKLWAISIRYAEMYKQCQQKAVSFFTEMFVAVSGNENPNQFKKPTRETQL